LRNKQHQLLNIHLHCGSAFLALNQAQEVKTNVSTMQPCYVLEIRAMIVELSAIASKTEGRWALGRALQALGFPSRKQSINLL
jgi:hypothetical protein